ncbi:MAG: MJ0042-type zinc finger domain-containing protein [Bdellovibrionales bacterium]
MIVACPLCQTRFLVAAGLFVGGARHVRCGRCRHVWMAELEQAGQEEGAGGIKAMSAQRGAVGDTPLGASPLVSQPLPLDVSAVLASVAGAMPMNASMLRRTLPLWARLTVVAALALLFVVGTLWGIVGRHEIALRWPHMTEVYDKVGLDSHQPGDGIDFREVKSELVYDGGILRLTVEGNLVNATEKEQIVPHILAVAVGSDGSTIQSWRIDAPAATLAPLATASFRSAINAPREGVAHVNLNFVGRKNVAD